MATWYVVEAQGPGGYRRVSVRDLVSIREARHQAHRLWYDEMAAAAGLDTAAGRKAYEEIMRYDGYQALLVTAFGHSLTIQRFDD